MQPWRPHFGGWLGHCETDDKYGARIGNPRNFYDTSPTICNLTLPPITMKLGKVDSLWMVSKTFLRNPPVKGRSRSLPLHGSQVLSCFGVLGHETWQLKSPIFWRICECKGNSIVVWGTTSNLNLTLPLITVKCECAAKLGNLKLERQGIPRIWTHHHMFTSTLQHSRHETNMLKR